MTTKITIWGTGGRIFADRQECQVYLRDTADAPRGLRAGLERALHHRADRRRSGSTCAARSTAPRSTHFVDARSRTAPVDGHQRLRERGRDRPHDRDDARRRRREGAVDAPPDASARRRRARSAAGAGGSRLGAQPAPTRRSRLETGRSVDGPAAVRRQPVLRRQPHVRGEGARPGDALPATSTPSSTCSTRPTTRASAPSCARRTTASR